MRKYFIQMLILYSCNQAVLACNLTNSDLNKLNKVHPDLKKVVIEANKITKQCFIVAEGVRTLQRQRIYVKRGASKTLNSKHLTGHAVDLWPINKGKIKIDWEGCTEISKAMKKAAHNLHINITWGGDWESFKDGPHYQIRRNK